MLIIVGQQLDQIGGFFLRKNMGVTWGEKVLLFLEGFFISRAMPGTLASQI